MDQLKITKSSNLSSSSSSSSNSPTSSKNSSSNSSSSSSSSSSDSDEELPPQNEVKVPSNKDKGKESEKSKVIASGSVVNDQIRVVPMKEVKEPWKKKSFQKDSPREAKAKKDDPNFKCSTGSTKVTPKSIRDQPGSSSALTTPGSETPSSSKRSLRNRTKLPVFNEKFLFAKQHEGFLEQEKEKRNKTSKNKKKSKAIDEDAPEIDGDTPPTFLRMSGRTQDWDMFLRTLANIAWVAPVDYFKYAPHSKIWKDFARVGVKIEVPNPFVICDKPVYWVATIMNFAGYKALIEYENFGDETPYVTWMSYCSDVPRPIGYCEKKRILLCPPPEIFEKHKDFLEKIRKIVTEEGVMTVKEDHSDTVCKDILAGRKYQLMSTVEVLDCHYPARNRLARVTGIVGDRIHITYTNGEEDDPGFFFNVFGEYVHKIGWSHTVGQKIFGVPRGVRFEKLPAEEFPAYSKDIKIKRGMVFEAIHPIELNLIVAATVKEALNYGYFMAHISTNKDIEDLDFCFHITSNWVLPTGFAERNGIQLTVPCDESEENFSWDAYCAKKQAIRLDLSSLYPKPPHKFVVGTKMEAIDLRQPTFCGPVTVIKTAEHLLFLHFDGWARDNPQALQWIDSESPNIYPAGWAEMVSHEFQSSPTEPRPEDRGIVVKDVPTGEHGSDLSNM